LLKDGPRTLLAQPRVLRLRLALNGEGATDGVTTRVLGARALLVDAAVGHSSATPTSAPGASASTRILAPGADTLGAHASAGSGWAGAPVARAAEPLDLHGERLLPELRPGDAIIRINGLTHSHEMLAELKRRPRSLVMLVLRSAGGARPGQPGYRNVAADAAAENGSAAEAFDVEARFDGELVSLVEDIKKHVLLPEAEASVAMRLVENDLDELSKALEALRQRKRTENDDDADLAAEEEDPDLVPEPGLEDEAQKRVHLLGNRRRLEEGLRKLYSEKETDEENHYKSNLALRESLADPTFDADKLQVAIDNFFRLCPFQAKSPAAKALVARARILVELWTFRRRCGELRHEVLYATKAALKWEAKRRAAETWPYAPKGTEAEAADPCFKELLEQTQEYVGELGFVLQEAKAVLERHEWASLQRPPKSDAFRKDNMAGPLMSLRLGELEGWWKRPQVD